MKRNNILLFFLLVACLYSCTSTKSTQSKGQAYASLYAEKPLAIAVMPPINKTNNVEAKEFLYLTLSQPLSERGYYVIPPFLCMEMYKSESAYDSEMFIDGSMKRFGDVLGADAVLFTTITRWEKAALAATVNVEIEYLLKSTKSNEILYNRKGQITYDASSNTGNAGLLGALVNMAASALNTAITAHVKVARACNSYTLSDMPAGIYSPDFDTDQLQPAGEKEFKQVIK